MSTGLFWSASGIKSKNGVSIRADPIAFIAHPINAPAQRKALAQANERALSGPNKMPCTCLFELGISCFGEAQPLSIRTSTGVTILPYFSRMAATARAILG